MSLPAALINPTQRETTMKITRHLCETNMDECYKQCRRYAKPLDRKDWEDDRGFLSAFSFVNGKTLFKFTLLNGEVISSKWSAV